MSVADEFAGAYPFPLDPPKRMTTDQHAEAKRLLMLLPDAVGALPVEVVWMLRQVLDRRDAAALGLLADLRNIDGQVRS